MSPPRAKEDSAPLRRFLLERTPAEGAAQLAEGEAEHAQRVLRLSPGDRLIGLDGRGAAWPLRVSAARRGVLALEATGEPQREPVPGAPGASLPWVELALPLPRGARAEELVDRATQLGAAAIRWLSTARTRTEARDLSPNRRRRLERIAAEACKQCGRLWLPEQSGPQPLAELRVERRGAWIVLDPRPAARPLGEVLDELECQAGSWQREHPLVLLAGPEGGLSPEEVAELRAGTPAARLAPYVLRVETAAEAALAVVVERAGG